MSIGLTNDPARCEVIINCLALDDSTNYPSQFRVNDALDAAQEMGLISNPDDYYTFDRRN